MDRDSVDDNSVTTVIKWARGVRIYRFTTVADFYCVLSR